MTPRLFVRDDAAADIQAAAAWYDNQRRGLGTEYARAIRAQLAAVEREPRLFRVVHRDVRRALVRRSRMQSISLSSRNASWYSRAFTYAAIQRSGAHDSEHSRLTVRLPLGTAH